MAFFTRNRVIFIALAAVMLTTRLHHSDVLPDASWAVLFLGGFYLRSSLAFSALMVEAVAIDYVATQNLVFSSYCLSPAYVMLLPAYAALWFGGACAQRLWRDARPIGIFTLSSILLVSISLCFLITNGSFYWLSGRVPSPNVADWFVNFRRWYPHFVLVPCAYVSLAIAAQVIGLGLRRGMPAVRSLERQHQ